MKRRRLLEYVKGTVDDKRVVKCNDITNMRVFVDASYTTHSDMKSHTGGLISFGTRATHTKSSKQRLNVKISAEAEIVGVSEYITCVIWLRNFLEHQGYANMFKKVYQDNESSIMMNENSKDSCSGRSRHIDIRLFL